MQTSKQTGSPVMVPAAVHHDAIRALCALHHHCLLLKLAGGPGLQLAMAHAARVLAEHVKAEDARTEQANLERVIPEHLRAPADDYHGSDSHA